MSDLFNVFMLICNEIKRKWKTSHVGGYGGCSEFVVFVAFDGFDTSISISTDVLTIDKMPETLEKIDKLIEQIIIANFLK